MYKSKVCDKYENEKGNKDTFRITKINFLENQIVIGPQEALENKNTIRKKILLKKSEENSIKKLSIITTANKVGGCFLGHLNRGHFTAVGTVE